MYICIKPNAQFLKVLDQMKMYLYENVLLRDDQYYSWKIKKKIKDTIVQNKLI